MGLTTSRKTKPAYKVRFAPHLYTLFRPYHQTMWDLQNTSWQVLDISSMTFTKLDICRWFDSGLIAIGMIGLTTRNNCSNTILEIVGYELNLTLQNRLVRWGLPPLIYTIQAILDDVRSPTYTKSMVILNPWLGHMRFLHSKPVALGMMGVLECRPNCGNPCLP